VLADAIADVTAVSDRYGDNPLGTRAIGLFDVTTPSRSLDVLGRCTRTVSCDGPSAAGGLPAKLHLVNGEVINRKVVSADGRLHALLAAGKTDAAIVAEVYRRAYGRNPTQTEAGTWAKRFANMANADRTDALEDFLWAVLNSGEFAQNR
jgi:hypothetical protein